MIMLYVIINIIIKFEPLNNNVIFLLIILKYFVSNCLIKNSNMYNILKIY